MGRTCLDWGEEGFSARKKQERRLPAWRAISAGLLVLVGVRLGAEATRNPVITMKTGYAWVNGSAVVVSEKGDKKPRSVFHFGRRLEVDGVEMCSDEGDSGKTDCSRFVVAEDGRVVYQSSQYPWGFTDVGSLQRLKLPHVGSQ